MTEPTYPLDVDLRAEGDLLIVREGARIPKVCVKCGATKDVSRREIPFAVGNAAAGAGLAGGVIGASVASVLRNVLPDEPVLQAFIIALLLGGVILVAWVVNTRTPKIHLQVPVCAEHGARLDRARRNVLVFLAALGIAGVMCIAGVGADAMVLIVIGLAVFAVALVAAFATGMKDAWVTARWAKDEHVALAIGPETAKKIVERAEKRAAKKQRALAAAS